MDKKQRILWGGATASSQYEGGFTDSKGLDTQDCRAYLPRTSNATEENTIINERKKLKKLNDWIAASIIRLETGQKVLNIWKKILNT